MVIKRCLFALSLSLLFGGAAPAGEALSRAVFRPLGDLPGGEFKSSANAVSADGTTVVGYSSAARGDEAFVWTPETGMFGLGDLPGGESDSTATAVSADGSVVVGGATTATGKEAFRWTVQTGMVGIGYLPGGSLQSVALGVSADGSVVVGWSRVATGPEAFRWTAQEGMRGVGFLADSPARSEAHAVSGDGTVIVGTAQSSRGVEAFRWTAADGMVGLGDLEGGEFRSEVWGISPDGTEIVGYGSTAIGILGFRWTVGEHMLPIGDPRADICVADGVSREGVIVGFRALPGRSGGPLPQQAFVWDAGHGLRALRHVLIEEYGLDLVGWELQAATGISADGMTIVGWGTNPQGKTEGWLVSLPHSTVEPSSWLARNSGVAVVVAVGLVAVIVLVVMGVLRRKRSA